MKWEDCQRKPEKLKHLVHLEGAEEPRNCINIIFEPDEQGMRDVNVLWLLTIFITSCSEKV